MEKVIKDRIEKIVGGGLYNIIDENEFSRRGCEYCNGGGGKVMTISGSFTLNDAQLGYTHEHDLCGECLYKLIYGEEVR